MVKPVIIILQNRKDVKYFWITLELTEFIVKFHNQSSIMKWKSKYNFQGLNFVIFLSQSLWNT